jgi:hypothetical protein
VASWRKPGFPVWAAWFVCLPAALQAFPGDSSQVYTIPLPASVAAAKVELQVAYGGLPAQWANGWPTSATSLGGWKVTVSIDSTHCEIHCTYRRTRDTLLLKPITLIRIYAGPGSKPTTLIVDPAGLKLPAAASQVAICQQEFGLPGKWWAAALPAPDGSGAALASIYAHPGFSETHSPAAHTAPLPLRR